MNLLSNKKNFLLLIIFFVIGFFVRFYNLNFHDYWWDEMLSFWIEKPNLSYEETLYRRNLTDETSILYHFILKIYYQLAGYDSEIGRYVSLFFGLLSLPLLAILSYKVKPNQSYILAFVLISINSYLISYSQENRHYAYIFVLSITNLIFFYNIFFSEKLESNKILNNVFFIFFSILCLSAQPFTSIILFSQIIFVSYHHIILKRKNYSFFVSAFIILSIYFLLNYDFVINHLISKEDHFVKQVEWIFLYDLFFSRFFGSKIMGGIYLLILLFLIIKFYKEIFFAQNSYLFLLIILIFSYLAPFIYSLLFIPILFDRYIIYVLIPIIILISVLIFEIKNNKIRNALIIFLIISSFTNLFFKTVDNKKTKPDFREVLNYIKEKDSGISKITLIKSSDVNNLSLEIVENYITSLKVFKKNKFSLYKMNDLPDTTNYIWTICYKPFVGFDCQISKNNWISEDVLKLHLIEAQFFKIKN